MFTFVLPNPPPIVEIRPIHPPQARTRCAFLVLVLPANIHAAYQRIDFGGHAAGPAYLMVRVPLQLLLLGWVYWHCVRPHAAAT